MATTNQFRLYTMTPDNHVGVARSFECGSAEEAIELAKQLVDEHALEVWSGAICIGRIEPKKSAH